MPANIAWEKTVDADPGRTAVEMSMENQTEQTRLLNSRLGRSDFERFV
jgi:hypothetical protein